VKRGKVTNKGRLAASLAFNCGFSEVYRQPSIDGLTSGSHIRGKRKMKSKVRKRTKSRSRSRSKIAM